MFRRALRGKLTVAAVAAATLLALTACSNPGPTASEPTPITAADSAASLAAAYDGAVGAPPTDEVTVTPDLTVWVVSCGEISTTCSAPAAGAVEAAEAIGWKGSVCDGKLNPDGWGTCVRQGIAADADVIVTVGQDCAAISGALTEAKDAGIVSVNVGGLDCDPGLYSANVQDLGGFTYEQYWKKVGELQAEWLIGQTDGAVKLLKIGFNDTKWGPLISAGLEERLAECEGCSIVGTVQLSNSDLATGALAQKFSTALLQNGSANSVAVPADGWFLAGLAQAISSSGRSDEVNVVGNFGGVPVWEVIRSNGGADATVATSQEWQGWATIDAALRVLAGQDVLPAGIGLQIVDADMNLPASGEQFTFTPPIDFKAAYQAVWKQ